MYIFTCKDQFEDMMTCVYEAWASRKGHGNVKLMTEPVGTMELFCEYRHVDADDKKAQSVIRTIKKKISSHGYQMIYRAALAEDADKLDAIYRFLVLGFRYGGEVLTCLREPAVLRLFALDRKVNNEAHHFREFLRFTEKRAREPVLVGRIAPKNDILPLLADCFLDRLPSENWMIIDGNRHTAVVHPADGKYYLTVLTREELEYFTDADADETERLWRGFFRSVGIKERKNPRCQRNLLPLRYREDMPEFR